MKTLFLRARIALAFIISPVTFILDVLYTGFKENCWGYRRTYRRLWAQFVEGAGK